MKTCFLSLLLLSIVGAAEQPDAPTGLILNKPGAFAGYNLFAPLDSGTTYLIDNEGRLIHTWESEFGPSSVYLLENGNLLRTSSLGREGNGTFHGGGAGHGIEEFSWDGTLLWQYVYSTEEQLMHHDIELLPNGNVLILAWEMKSAEEAVAAGRAPDLLTQEELWPEHILEIKPTRPQGAEVVWEWHLWDHLIQDVDETKANYGDVAAHPELVDINPTGHWMDRISEEEFEELEALGYLGGDETTTAPKRKKRRGTKGSDWLHTNAIAYNAQLDQIVLSVLGNNELWILDHSTTTAEAAGHMGGRSGKGGDLLYRWGNPTAYRAGTEDNQRLFAQHDVHWIPDGLPGAGHIVVFNNGRGRSDGFYSSVDEIVTPLEPDGTYSHEPFSDFGPDAPVWSYTAVNKKDFYSFFISGAQRLPNGNTLICEGATGTFFEVTADKETVWRYVNPAVPPLHANLNTAKGKKGKKGKGKTRGRKPSNIVFRVHRYAMDYPGFKGKDLTPGPLLTVHLKTNPASRSPEFRKEQ